eukprot:4024505-Prorocentrum_lima.AAC.1
MGFVRRGRVRAYRCCHRTNFRDCCRAPRHGLFVACGPRSVRTQRVEGAIGLLLARERDRVDADH